MTNPILSAKVREFTDNVEQNTTTPLYELTPEQAREVLETTQKIPVQLPPVNIEDLSVPADGGRSITVKIVRPQNSGENLPIIYYIHGGGWIMGSFETHRRLVSELADKTKAAVVFPIYTPSPEAQYPQPTGELFTALQYIADNAAQYNLNAKRLIVAGDSVGGNMAAVMTLMAKDSGFKPLITAQLLLYPVTAADFETDSYQEFANGPWLTKKAMQWFWDAYAPIEQSRQDIYASPLNATTRQLSDLPPALIITDQNDVLRDEGEAYAIKLAAAGVKTTSVRVNGTIHDFMMLNPLAESEPTRSAVLFAAGWLKQFLTDSEKF